MKNKDLKILFISHVSGLGGAERSMLELISGLTKRGFYCSVILPFDGPLANELRKMKITFDIIFLPWCADGGKEYDKNRIGEITKSVNDLIEFLKKNDFDVVYSNSSVILQGALAAKILGLKHVWHIREFGELDYDLNFYLKIKERAKFVFNYSDKIIFISDALREYYQSYIPDLKSEVVYNNVRMPKLSKDANLKISKNKKGLKLLIIGNVHRGKGQIDAIKAIKTLRDKGIDNIFLKIVGGKSPEYYEELLDFTRKNDLENQIEFFDFVDMPGNFFIESDIVLMCSRSEGFGRVTVEAMLCGKPVIGANAGGTSEIIENGKNGLMYNPGDVEDLADKIMFFYENRNEIDKFGQYGKEYCKNKFSEEKYVGRIDRILKNINQHKSSFFYDEANAISTLYLSLMDDLKIKDISLNKTNMKFAENEKELVAIKRKLAIIKSSKEFKIGLLLQKIVKKIFPSGSFQRKAGNLLFNSAKRIFRLKNNFKSILLFIRYYLKMCVSKRRSRTINCNSKKIVFVGHSYHGKTKSTDFILQYLKKFYDVEVILDESWQGDNEKFPDVSFIDDSYLAVIFWQNLPKKEILDTIKNDNIIFFPMYDACGTLGFDYWFNLRGLKIINFSKTLNTKLARWGFETMHVQYFPDLHEFLPGKKDEVFFWQRLTGINFDLISKLFAKTSVKMHLHKVIDPGQEFQQPTNEQEKEFQIAYSDWFETREEMWDVIKQNGIYVAPREYEGIGMSFLEAMSMGKAVVAVNNPTMNEYIEDGKNGYLFDLKNPKAIDFSNIEEIQKNAYEFMQKGFEKWEKDKQGIIDFITKA